MKKITYKCSLSDEYYTKQLRFYFNNRNIGVFDIETTGLKAENCHVILIGFMKISETGSMLYQYFAEDISEERDIVAAFLDDLKGTGCLVNFNGDRFDIPFLKKRMKHMMYDGDTSSFDKASSLDIYRIINRYSDLRTFLKSLNQKSVEEYMGIGTQRKDEISGADSVKLYFDYVSSPDSKKLEKILLHNRDDVYQLYQLLPVLRYADLHKAFFETGFPAQIQNRADGLKTYLEIKEIKIGDNSLDVYGKQLYNKWDCTLFGDDSPGITADFSSQTGLFHVSCPLISHSRSKVYHILDIGSLCGDTGCFENQPQYDDGMLVLRKDKEIFYRPVNEAVLQILAGLNRKEGQ